MSLKCRDILYYLEEKAPLSLAEEWDNVGLMTGSIEKEVSKVMLCLDVTEAVVSEAIEKKVDMLISHHPLIFSKLRNINDRSNKGRILLKLIRNDINVYSAHTNLDVADGGVNDSLADVLGLKNLTALSPYKQEKLFKIVVFIPQGHEDAVRDEMSKAGAGWIGKYSDCAFMTEGTGTFRPMEGTNPYIGQNGVLEKVHEIKLETIVPQSSIRSVTKAMLKAHPYEEVAYDIYPLEINGKEYSLGKLGVLDNPLSLNEFIAHVKKNLCLGTLRLVGSVDKEISKVAVFCGSFDESIIGYVKSKADILVTGDLKYHTAHELLENHICAVDAGHFNTEKVIIRRLEHMLKDKFHELDVIMNTVEADPFKFC